MAGFRGDMIPVNFNQETGELAPPPNMPECQPLPVAQTETSFISCWQLTEEEVSTLIKSKRIFLEVHSMAHPPVSLVVAQPENG